MENNQLILDEELSEKLLKIARLADGLGAWLASEDADLTNIGVEFLENVLKIIDNIEKIVDAARVEMVIVAAPKAGEGELSRIQQTVINRLNGAIDKLEALWLATEIRAENDDVAKRWGLPGLTQKQVIDMFCTWATPSASTLKMVKALVELAK